MIRRATVRDLPSLVRHRRGMFEELGLRCSSADDRRYAAWLRARLASARAVGFVAEKKGRIVAGGCVWLQERQPRPGFRGGPVPCLLSMFTEPEHRGNGLATRIVKAAMGWCRARGFRRMTLHASKMGRRLYEKLGWARTWEMAVEL